MALAPGSIASPAAALDAARAALAALEHRMTSGFSDEEVVEGVEAAQRLKASTAALEAMLVAEADSREIARKQLHYGSTADWITHCGGLYRREGRRIVEHAKQLVDDQDATLGALWRGDTSPVQAGVIVAAMDHLPLNPELRGKAETVLLEESTRLTATELAKAARHLVDVVDPDKAERKDEAALDREERGAHRDRFLSVTDDGMGGVRIKGRCSVEDGETLRTALLPLTRPEPAVDPDDHDSDPAGAPTRDPRDQGARMLDALIRLAQHALDTNMPPESHGARPRVGVVIPLEDLRNGDGQPCPTDTGLEVSPETARRLACDADIIPGVLGSKGEVLDVGRAARLVTAAIWMALVLRDHHCAFPGCTRPPVMTQAHHIKHWANGGITALINLVLLCGEHHRTIHHTPWEVRINPDDALPEFLPPPRRRDPDAPREWIRHRRRLE